MVRFLILENFIRNGSLFFPFSTACRPLWDPPLFFRPASTGREDPKPLFYSWRDGRGEEEAMMTEQGLGSVAAWQIHRGYYSIDNLSAGKHSEK
jgi:hypothetical protein